MSRKRTLVVSMTGVLVALAAAAAIAIAQGLGSGADPNELNRYAAHFFSGPELSTEAAPANNGRGGVVIYERDIDVDEDNVLFVSIFTTGDTHDGAKLLLSCTIDDAPCGIRFAGGAAGSPSGWVTLQRHEDYNDDYSGAGYVGDGGGGAGDLHDNAIAFQWCGTVTPETGHTVRIRMASLPSPDVDNPDIENLVFIESPFFFVDGAEIDAREDRCRFRAPPQSSALRVPDEEPNGQGG